MQTESTNTSINLSDTTGSVTAVRQHYDNLLAQHYSWMCGNFEDRISAAQKFFQEIGLGSTGTAIDLGCGSGIQSIALARLGYETKAIDFCGTLLKELEERSRSLPVRTLQADITDLKKCDLSAGDVVICMGDTLTHLPDQKTVEEVVTSAATRLLKEQGTIILEFRDLTMELTGTDRIIPVKTDHDRVMLTFLEYLPEQVMVHDTVLSQNGNEWTTSKSVYPKLRIAPAVVRECLHRNGLTVVHDRVDRGMCRIVAERS